MKIKRDATVDAYITEALLKLLEKKVYKDISITEICEKAGVTRMSFYRNFDSKEDILFRHVREITDAFLEESSINYKSDSTHEYFIKLFTHMYRQKELCLHLYKAGLIYMVKDEFDRVFLERHSGEYDEYKSYFLAGGIYNVFLLWLKNGCRESPEERADRLELILIR